MKTKIFIGLIAFVLMIFILISCNNSASNKVSEEELELHKRELELKQKELELKEKELAQQSIRTQTKTDNLSTSNTSKAETIKKVERIQKNNEIVTNSTEISVDNFGINDISFEGCSCYLSESKQQYNNSKCIFASNLNDIAYVKINNKIIKLNSQEGTEIYSNKTITIKINLKSINGSSENEGERVEGTIIISTKDGQNIKKTIYGSRGC